MGAMMVENRRLQEQLAQHNTVMPAPASTTIFNNIGPRERKQMLNKMLKKVRFNQLQIEGKLAEHIPDWFHSEFADDDSTASSMLELLVRNYISSMVHEYTNSLDTMEPSNVLSAVKLDGVQVAEATPAPAPAECAETLSLSDVKYDTPCKIVPPGPGSVVSAMNKAINMFLFNYFLSDRVIHFLVATIVQSLGPKDDIVLCGHLALRLGLLQMINRITNSSARTTLETLVNYYIPKGTIEFIYAPSSPSPSIDSETVFILHKLREQLVVANVFNTQVLSELTKHLAYMFTQSDTESKNKLRSAMKVDSNSDISFRPVSVPDFLVTDDGAGTSIGENKKSLIIDISDTEKFAHALGSSPLALSCNAAPGSQRTTLHFSASIVGKERTSDTLQRRALLGDLVTIDTFALPPLRATTDVTLKLPDSPELNVKVESVESCLAAMYKRLQADTTKSDLHAYAVAAVVHAIVTEHIDGISLHDAIEKTLASTVTRKSVREHLKKAIDAMYDTTRVASIMASIRNFTGRLTNELRDDTGKAIDANVVTMYGGAAKR